MAWSRPAPDHGRGLVVRAGRGAGGDASDWLAARTTEWIVLHASWVLPVSVGVATFVLRRGMIDAGADVPGNGILPAIAAVGSAVAWGTPACLLALPKRRRFLARKDRALELQHDV